MSIWNSDDHRKPIEEFPEFEVSTSGHIFHNDEQVKEFWLKGQRVVYLPGGEEQCPSFKISRLVAEAFCPKPVEGKQNCYHRDRNPLNNAADNLLWLTPSEGTKLFRVSRKKRLERLKLAKTA